MAAVLKEAGRFSLSVLSDIPSYIGLRKVCLVCTIFAITQNGTRNLCVEKLAWMVVDSAVRREMTRCTMLVDALYDNGLEKCMYLLAVYATLPCLEVCPSRLG